MSLVPFRPSVAAALLLASGCASYAPRPLVPAAELERLRAVEIGQLEIEYAPSAAPLERAPLRFDTRDGLDEAELAALALTLNPGLRAKRAGIGVSQAELVTAGLLPNPDLGAFVRTGVGGTSGTSFGLDALFGLLLPEERAAKREVAEAEIERVRAGLAREELQLVSEVRGVRIAVLAAEQSERILQRESALRDEALALVQKQRDLGEATAIALALAELDRVAVRRQLRDAHSTVERERRALNALLGVPPAVALELAGSGSDLVFTIADEPSDEELDAALLAGRAELREREASYQLAEQQLRLAIARQFPGIALGPSYEKDIEGSESLGLATTVELPLFDRNQGEIAARTAQRERRRAEYVATLHDLRARAFEARAALRRARAEFELQQAEVLPVVQRTEALFESALRAHELSVFEWLAARTRAIQARKDLLDALTRYAQAAVELDAVTGAPLVSVVTQVSGDEAQR